MTTTIDDDEVVDEVVDDDCIALPRMKTRRRLLHHYFLLRCSLLSSSIPVASKLSARTLSEVIDFLLLLLDDRRIFNPSLVISYDVLMCHHANCCHLPP